MRMNGSTPSDKAAALDWLARQLRWEHTLEALRASADRSAHAPATSDDQDADVIQPAAFCCDPVAGAA